MKNKKLNSTRTAWFLTPVILCFAIATDIYIPALIDIQSEFRTTGTYIQLSLSLFVVFLGLGQLILGPLSEAIGRKRTMVLSTITYTTCNLLCITSTCITTLILFRSISGIASSGMLVTAYATLKDSYSNKKLTTNMAILTATMSFAPVVGPIVGSIIINHINWRGVFFFLAVLGMATVLITTFLLQESLPKRKRLKKLDISYLKKSYKHCFINNAFMKHSMISSFGLIGFFCFISTSPFILINSLELKKYYFGYVFAAICFVFLICNIFSKQLEKFEKSRVYACFGALQAAISLLAIIFFSLAHNSIIFFLLFMAITSGCLAIFITQGASAALNNCNTQHVGSSSAVLGALQMISAAIVAQLFSCLFHMANYEYKLILFWLFYLLIGSNIYFLSLVKPAS